MNFQGRKCKHNFADFRRLFYDSTDYNFLIYR